MAALPSSGLTRDDEIPVLRARRRKEELTTMLLSNPSHYVGINTIRRLNVEKVRADTAPKTPRHSHGGSAGQGGLPPSSPPLSPGNDCKIKMFQGSSRLHKSHRRGDEWAAGTSDLCFQRRTASCFLFQHEHLQSLVHLAVMNTCTGLLNYSISPLFSHLSYKFKY